MSAPAIKSPTPELEAELAAIKTIWGYLEAMHPEGRKRVLTWINQVFGP